jgi:hypothetical protein
MANDYVLQMGRRSSDSSAGRYESSSAWLIEAARQISTASS